MGEEVDAQEFSRADRTRYREKVRRCLDVFARMLREARFDTDDPMTGLEVELNLVDEHGDPALKNAEALAAIADPAFQTELGQFNIEINVPPAKLREGGLATFEESLRRSLNDAEVKSSEVGAHLVMIGILPTLADGHMTADSLSANPRYKLLSEQILDARGEDISISIAGVHGAARHDLRLDRPRGGLHQHPVPRADLARRLRRRTGTPRRRSPSIQLALGANSPYLLGKELWRETRIPLFEQATDTRSEELKAQGVRPRVWFGERWITSVFDLFEENVRYFPALLPITDDEDPLAVLESGGTPTAARAAAAQRHDLPLEPSGLRHRRAACRTCGSRTGCSPPVRRWPTRWPTPRSTSVWSGRWPTSERPLWSQMSFSAAEENFHVAAQQGIEAQVYWPGVGQVRATELVLRRLLPLAHEGLTAWGVDQASADRLLGIIEQRCLTGVNGAEWFASPDGAADRPGPLRRPARDPARLPRADAHQRAGPHLGLSCPVTRCAGAPRFGRCRCAGRTSPVGSPRPWSGRRPPRRTQCASRGAMRGRVHTARADRCG